MANRRIGGKGGGSDKGDQTGTIAVVALAFALALGAGGTSAVIEGSTGTGSSGASSGAPSPKRVGGQDSRAVEARLVRQGVRVVGRVTDNGTSCVEHSYGQVNDFMRRNPCAGLHRASLVIRDHDGDVVLLAVSWVQMPDEASARTYKDLVDTHGTGNITELSRERGRYRTVRFTGHPYASRRDGTVVVNAQAQPVARGATGLALTSIVTEAVR